MTASTIEDVANLAAYLAQRPTYTSTVGVAPGAEPFILSPVPAHVAAREAIALAKVARRMHRLDEMECNGDISEERAQRRERGLSRQAEEIAAAFGLICYRQGDPRGWPL